METITILDHTETTARVSLVDDSEWGSPGEVEPFVTGCLASNLGGSWVRKSEWSAAEGPGEVVATYRRK